MRESLVDLILTTAITATFCKQSQPRQPKPKDKFEPNTTCKAPPMTTTHIPLITEAYSTYNPTLQSIPILALYALTQPKR